MISCRAPRLFETRRAGRGGTPHAAGVLVNLAFLAKRRMAKTRDFVSFMFVYSTPLFLQALTAAVFVLLRPARTQRQICFPPRFLRFNRPYPFLFKAIASYRIWICSIFIYNVTMRMRNSMRNFHTPLEKEKVNVDKNFVPRSCLNSK